MPAGAVANNYDSAYRHVICPVMSDLSHATSWGQDIWLHDNNNNPNYYIYCYLYEQDPLGGSFHQSNWVATNSTSTYTGKVKLSTSLSSYFTDGVYYWYCALPPDDSPLGKSAVMQYFLSED